MSSESGQTRQRPTPREEVTTDDQPTATRTESAEEALEDVDELLDEIDEVLEENAEEFIKNYVQKGGQ